MRKSDQMPKGINALVWLLRIKNLPFGLLTHLIQISITYAIEFSLISQFHSILYRWQEIIGVHNQAQYGCMYGTHIAYIIYTKIRINKKGDASYILIMAHSPKISIERNSSFESLSSSTRLQSIIENNLFEIPLSLASEYSYMYVRSVLMTATELNPFH